MYKSVYIYRLTGWTTDVLNEGIVIIIVNNFYYRTNPEIKKKYYQLFHTNNNKILLDYMYETGEFFTRFHGW